MTSELENRNIAVSMRKSVENLVISSQDAIGQSISQALTFGGAISQHANQIIENRSVSRSPSPSLLATDTDASDNNKQNEISIQVPTQPASDTISISSQGESTPSTYSKNLDTLAKGQRSSEGSRSKKKSWYSSLYPTYKSRSEDFKKLFKDLPDDERLIVDYSCALQKDILAHGRLYVSQNYLCFYANIFGWETCVSLRWKDVTSITKDKTALVIPNAISVSTDTERHFLTSFSGRDKAYLMLFRVWQHALMDQAISMQEIWQWVRSCYGEELGFNSDDEGYAREFEEDKTSLPAIPTNYFMESSSAEAGAGEDSGDRLDASRPAFNRSISQPPERTHNGLAAVGEVAERDTADVLPTDMSDSSDSEQEKDNIEIERCKLNHEGRQFIKAEFPINIDQMFTMIFTNSKFNLELLTARGASDYIQAAWQHDPQSGLKCRQISYTIGLASGPIGPKEVYVTETQIMNKCSKPGVLYSIDATSENAGIPYAEYFSVFAHYCLTKLSESSTLLVMHSSIKYKKSVWTVVRGFLEKNALGGVEQFARLLESRLLAEAERAPTRKSGRRRRRICDHTVSAENTAAVVSSAVNVPSSIRSGLGTDVRLNNSSVWWCGVLVLLLLINALLYWRLYLSVGVIEVGDLQSRLGSLSPEQMSQWSTIMDQHSQQLQRWRTALDSAVDSLKQESILLWDPLTRRNE